MLDAALTITLDAGRGARANGKEAVIRRRYQTGCLFIRGKRRKVWVARWREDVIAPDGTLQRCMRSEVLGLVKDFPNRREAQRLLENRLRPVNQGRQVPQSTLTFERFVREKWEPGVVPTLRPGSTRYYGIQIRCHLMPAFSQRRLCDITRAEVQCFLAEKRKQGLSGSTIH